MSKISRHTRWLKRFKTRCWDGRKISIAYGEKERESGRIQKKKNFIFHFFKTFDSREKEKKNRLKRESARRANLLTQPSSSQTHIPTHSSSALLSSLLDGFLQDFRRPLSHGIYFNEQGRGGNCVSIRPKHQQLGRFDILKNSIFLLISVFIIWYSTCQIFGPHCFMFLHIYLNECLYVEFIFK